jgi:hypothetical protein
MLDFIRDRTDPDTLEHRNARGLREWHEKRFYGFVAVDPLSNADRVRAQYSLAVKRLEICRWLRHVRLVARKSHRYGPAFLRVVK